MDFSHHIFIMSSLQLTLIQKRTILQTETSLPPPLNYKYLPQLFHFPKRNTYTTPLKYNYTSQYPPHVSLFLSLKHMTRTLRTLQSTNSTTAPPPPESSAPVESDFVVILAALLCALISVVGLTAIARCTWLRRVPVAGAAGRSPAQAQANRGLKKKVVNSLPKFTYVDGSPVKWVVSSECAICLSEFAAGDEVRVLPQCGHGFHVACIDTWLGSHSSCPSCRAPFAVARCQKCGLFQQVPAAGATTSGGAGETDSKSLAGDSELVATNNNVNCISIDIDRHSHSVADNGFLP